MTSTTVESTKKRNEVGKNSQELYWDDLNKVKFLSLLASSSLVLRTSLHPLAVVKTRLQTQLHGEKGSYSMFKKVICEEGIRRGLYRGYSVSLSALLFEPVFMITLEKSRSFFNAHQPKSISKSQWDTLTSSASAATAALVQQTFLVPIDVTTQRVMITRARDGVRIIDIIREIYFRSGDGIKAFYKGYFITIGTSLPFNSIIWTLYWKIQTRLEKFIPFQYDYTIAPISSTMAALLTSLITQPIDVLKTRLQVAEKRQSLFKTLRLLIEQRSFQGLFSGSIPRACIVVPNSVIMMSLYEIIKRASVKQHFQETY